MKISNKPLKPKNMQRVKIICSVECVLDLEDIGHQVDTVFKDTQDLVKTLEADAKNDGFDSLVEYLGEWDLWSGDVEYDIELVNPTKQTIL